MLCSGIQVLGLYAFENSQILQQRELQFFTMFSKIMTRNDTLVITIDKDE